MIKYEYYVVDVDQDGLQSTMETAGSEGWKLSNAVYKGKSSKFYEWTLFFYREVSAS